MLSTNHYTASHYQPSLHQLFQSTGQFIQIPLVSTIEKEDVQMEQPMYTNDNYGT
jgi:hypothetical protein